MVHQTLNTIPTATLHEALGKIGALPSAIKAISGAMTLCGPAFTVNSMPCDNRLLHQAIVDAHPGDVLVVATAGYYEAGYWGEIMTLAAQVRKLAGLVIDGSVRDGDQIEALGFPVFARGLCIRGTTKYGDGTLGQPLTLGDIRIEQGDWIVGDRDGVMVVPQARVQEAIDKSNAREAHEAQMMARILGGETTPEIFGWA